MHGQEIFQVFTGLKVAPYGFDCVEHNHVQKFIIFSSCKERSQNSAT